MGKRICMILEKDFPPDIRLSKEIRTLSQSNYNNIYLLCNNNLGYPKEEFVDRIKVVRLKHYPFLNRKLQVIKNIPLFFNPIWIINIVKLVKKYKIDFLHVHDLPLLLAAIIIGKFFNIPIIYDMHENYPAALKLSKQKGLFPAIFKNDRFAAILDDFCVRRVEKIIVVVEEQKERLMASGVRGDKIYVVSNTVDNEYFIALPIYKEIVERYKNNFMILYLGSFGVERGLETAIMGMSYVINTISNAKLVLVGEGKNKGELINLAKTEGVSAYVDFVGWVDFEYCPSYINTSSVCIVPQPSNPCIDTTIPHKLFQYMALEKPVVVSDAKPLARIVRECNCGEVFKSNSPEDFAEAIKRISENRNNNCGINGRRAVREKYNWKNSSKQLIKLYHDLERIS